MAAGRQREFDKQIALDAAMELFWSNGYNGTSLSDLTNAMGINKPSLYAAFGNKEALCVSALNHYVSKYGSPHMDELNAPGKSLRSRLTAYLKSIAQMVSDPTLPGGCFVAATTNEAGGEYLPAGVSQAVAKINQLTRKTLIDFFRQEASTGTLGKTNSPDVLADYILTLQYGLAVMARNRAKPKVFEDVIEYAVSKF